MSWFHTPAPLVTHPPLIVARQSWNQQLLHQQRLRSRRSGSGSCGSLTRPPPCHHLSNMVICFTGFSFTTISVILRLPGRRSCLFTLPLPGTIIKLTPSKIRNRYISWVVEPTPFLQICSSNWSISSTRDEHGKNETYWNHHLSIHREWFFQDWEIWRSSLMKIWKSIFTS